MKAVATAISENVARAAPRQLMLFATSWSPLIGVFRDKFMTDAATVITSKIEASLACNVKQVIIPLFLTYTFFLENYALMLCSKFSLPEQDKAEIGEKKIMF